MKLAFFGKAGSFDYNNIGGTNSFVRRLSEELSGHYDVEVDLLLYGNEEKVIVHSEKFSSKYYVNLETAVANFRYYDHVVFIYMPVRDIRICRRLCRKMETKTLFHNLYQNWPDSIVKRKLYFFVNRFVPVNGNNYAISPRIFNELNKKGNNCYLLMPPVSVDYFVPYKEKVHPEKICVTYIGRIDVGKGILETIEIFKKLSSSEKVELKMYGLFWETDQTAVRIHSELMDQDHFYYKNIDFKNYSKEIDQMVKSVLYDTDIFIQPYRQLSSTIDCPMLILESMASLCAVITKPYGDIPEIYGESPCLIPDGKDFVQRATDLILSSDIWLDKERQRIHDRISALNFDTPHVTKMFMDSLLKENDI